METYAFGLIDAQRGFMPAAEGVRLDKPGFGELPINDGEKIVPVVNRLLAYFAIKGFTFTTQDWHPEETGHFAENPNFATTWPRHCVANTPGAALHPGIFLPGIESMQFLKGQTALKDGRDDDSYSGYNAINDFHGLRLPEFLRNRNVRTLVLGGLALDYCVGETALDFKQKTDMDVIVAIDATRAVAPDSGQQMLEHFMDHGIRVMDSRTIINLAEAGNLTQLAA